MDLPVWMYWSGACPEWVQACQATALRHAPGARLLSAADFEALREHDRDIDLRPLHVAHQADYIRAYLLAYHGGLWIDSDCVVMRPLQPVLDLLDESDFVGHFERQGRISNAFIASRPAGSIAVDYYSRVCAALRSGQPLSWLSLGAQALMETLGSTTARWHRLNLELVQPVCWSQPEVFFGRDTEQGHEERLNPRSICYMLSRNMVEQYIAGHAGDSLHAPDSFFSFLIKRSATAPVGPVATVRESAMHPASRALLPFCLAAIDDVRPRRVLDADLGFGRWGVLVHEACDDGQGRVHRENWSTHIEAVTVQPSLIEEYHHFFYNYIHVADPADLLSAGQADWDLVVVGDAPLRIPPDAAARLLAAALDRSRYVLALMHLDDEVGSDRPDDGRAWTASEILSLDPVRHELLRLDGRTYGAFLLSRSDPNRLAHAAPTSAAFTRIFEDNLWLSAESRSGPGSGLVQTAVIRREIPLVLKSLSARSLMDAPCGDLNWMRHVRLDLDRYIGVDLVPGLIALNRLRFGGDGRQFLALDIRADALPRVDTVLCRDGLVHLDFEDALATVANFKRSGSEYLLTTTFTERTWNEPIATGGWRPLNLRQPPFCFPEPIRLINEGCTEGGGGYADESLGLWRLSDLLS